MNPFAKTALSLLLGIGLGTLGTAVILNKRIAQQDVMLKDLSRCARVGGQMVTQEGWNFAQTAIREQHATIEKLRASQPETQIVTDEYGHTVTLEEWFKHSGGHVMNEAQCRAWVGMQSH
jgi:hypothetical protein